MKHFCGSIAETVESKTNILYVRFYAESQVVNATLTLWYTAFRRKQPGESKEPCAQHEFDCDDDTCIHHNLTCNKRFNCKFQNDEDAVMASCQVLNILIQAQNLLIKITFNCRNQKMFLHN